MKIGKAKIGNDVAGFLTLDLEVTTLETCILRVKDSWYNHKLYGELDKKQIDVLITILQKCRENMKNVGELAEELYGKVLSDGLIEAALKRYKKANDIGSSDHEKAIMFIMDSLGDLDAHANKSYYDELRDRLNNMISGGIS